MGQMPWSNKTLFLPIPICGINFFVFVYHSTRVNSYQTIFKVIFKQIYQPQKMRFTKTVPFIKVLPYAIAWARQILKKYIYLPLA